MNIKPILYKFILNKQHFHLKTKIRQYTTNFRAILFDKLTHTS